MIAKLAYLTSPSPNVFLLNVQLEDAGVMQFEISRAHLANIIIDGASFSLREISINRVPFNTKTTENAENERAEHRA